MADSKLKNNQTAPSGVRLNQVSKIFPSPTGGKDIVAVDAIDLEIAPGELMTLLGPSGCGKTTTLRIVSGFEIATAGEVYIGKRNVANVPPNRRGISMVFQSYALFPHLNVFDNVAYGLKVKKLPEAEIKERTQRAIDLMQLTGKERHFPNQLSGGQQQRVALSRAIVIEPKVLLFDEPLSNLDAHLREQMRDELRQLQQRLGITALYVTHDQSEAMAISDKIVVMKDGLIMQVGSPETIYERPESRFVANFIGKSNFIPCKLVEKKTAAAVVKVGDKLISCPNPGVMRGCSIGKTCYLSVRPEAATLVENEQEIRVTVDHSIYFGNHIEYHVRMGDLLFVFQDYRAERNRRFEPGETVYLELNKDALVVLS
ncbi:MAG TPA: ABC transporter ATP-binding protein [Clostridiaceae bacterium]|nr:ABC transporter ATP-binding protein [Clostridiaceae bacterium]